MSEIKIFYKDKEKIKVARTISALKELDKKDIIWIDLLDVSDKTEDTLEGFLKIDIQEDEEMEEIEFSSRYIQTDDSIVANSNFLKNNFEMEAVNFILKNSILVSIRDTELDTFNETFKKEAFRIFHGKGYTSTGVSATVCRIAAAIAADSREIFPVSTVLQGEYGVQGVAVSVPSVIGRSGVEDIREVVMSDEENAAFLSSVDIIRKAALTEGLL